MRYYYRQYGLYRIRPSEIARQIHLIVRRKVPDNRRRTIRRDDPEMHWKPTNLEKLRKKASRNTTFMLTPEPESIEFDRSMRSKQKLSMDLDESLNHR